MKKMKKFGIKSLVADNGIFPSFFTFLFLILTGIMVNRRYEKKNLGLLYSVGKITLKVRNSHVKLRKLAFFLKKIKTEYP
jgi:hypothetical protein